MKAIILAAGYATRLYPLTIDKPKPLLPVQGKPIIDYIVDAVNAVSGIDAIYVVSNHRFAGHFTEWARTAPGNIPVRVLDDGTSTEETRRGAIGDIQFCIEKEQIDDDLMIIAGDSLFTFSLANYYSFYRKLGSDCVCVKEINDVSQLRQFAVAVIDESGRITQLVEKPQEPPSNTAAFAIYIYKKDTIPLFARYLAEGNKPDAPGYFLQWLYTRKEVYGYKMDGECYDIGTPQAYAETQVMHL